MSDLPSTPNEQAEALRTTLAALRRANQRLTTQDAVTRALADSDSLAAAAPKVLRVVCEHLQWSAGGLWYVDEQANALRCSAVWHMPTVEVPRFEAASRERTFPVGVGLPGRVWASGKAAWIPDVVHDKNFPRGQIADQEGLHGAFGFPIVLEGEVLGVIEFFSSEVRQPDEDLLQMMTAIGGQIGQFIERKRAEAAHKESEERFARFMQHLPGLAWIKSVDGRYVYVNDAAEKAFATRRENLYGKTDGEIFPTEVAAQFRENDQQALASGSGVQVVETLRHDDGVVHHSIVSKFPIPGPRGEAMLVGGMAIDITERKRAENELREADRRKDEFLATLAHELRNPLAPIRNMLEVMKQGDEDADLRRQARETIERQLAQLVRLVDDLLDVSRITRDKLELRSERVNLSSIIDQAIETCRPLLDELGHELVVNLPAEPVQLHADPVRLAQVFSNLLHNACKFTRPHGRVMLSAEPQDGDVAIRFVDNGVGIAGDMLPTIFDIFAQADQSLERSQGGLGIGLTLVKRLVELHGGSITASSDGPGQGSKFVVRLPINMEAVADSAPSPATVARPPAARRILVVDDNRDSARSLALLLSITGHEMHTAYDGVEALEAAERFRPEVVLLDIGLPKMNGYDACRAMRECAWGKEITIIALTGWGQDDFRNKSKQAGFDGHLVKPVEFAVLTALLADLERTAACK
ncbi:MAG: ATP-binding protein [Pirellulales bacterium]